MDDIKDGILFNRYVLSVLQSHWNTCGHDIKVFRIGIVCVCVRKLINWLKRFRSNFQFSTKISEKMNHIRGPAIWHQYKQSLSFFFLLFQSLSKGYWSICPAKERTSSTERTNIFNLFIHMFDVCAFFLSFFLSCLHLLFNANGNSWHSCFHLYKPKREWSEFRFGWLISIDVLCDMKRIPKPNWIPW